MTSTAGPDLRDRRARRRRRRHGRARGADGRHHAADRRPSRRGMATGIVNAGGSFGQFVFAPIAQAHHRGGRLGRSRCRAWRRSTLLALPAAWVLRGNSLQPLAPAPARRRCARAAREADPRARWRAELPAAGRGLLRLRLPRRLHRHPPARRGRDLRAAAARWAPGRWRDRPVQHRRQPRHGLGRRAAGA